MNRILYIVIFAILLAGCAVLPGQTVAPEVDNRNETPPKSVDAAPQVKPEPKIVIQDEIMRVPPENPRFSIAQSPAVDATERVLTEAIKEQLLRLGYVEAATRNDANVVIWYNYYSEQTGTRYVGQATDIWGEQLGPVAVSDPNSITPLSFKVQIISLQESHFPGRVGTIWQGEWSSALPDMNLVEMSRAYLTKIFDQYNSEQNKIQIEAYRRAQERDLERAVNIYMKMVMYRIQKNWQKPQRNVKGKTCQVKIVQSMVGEISSVQMLACDKNRQFRKSIEKAIRKSSPLPMPQEELFDRRELILIFQG